MTIDEIDFIDGAHGCNNPAYEAYQEVIQMHNGNNQAVGLLLSVGTGQSEATRFGRNHIDGIVQTFTAAINHLTDTEKAHTVMSGLARLVKPLEYRRFNVPEDLGIGQMRMDLWNDVVRQRIEERTAEYLSAFHDKEDGQTEDVRLKDIAKTLVAARRKRAATKRWPLSISRIRYRCTIENCDNGQQVRNTFDDMWNHIAMKHVDHETTLLTKANATSEQRKVMEDIINSGQIEH